MRSRIQLVPVADGIRCFRQRSYVRPGHRRPRTDGVAAQLDSLRWRVGRRIGGAGWPLLG